MEAVHGQGGLALDAEADPPAPLRAEGVDRQHLHEGGERLVQPDAVPPPHGDQVAEPHVGDLVADDVGHPLELDPRRLVGVDQQDGSRNVTQPRFSMAPKAKSGMATRSSLSDG